jgi:hypothetical protein
MDIGDTPMGIPETPMPFGEPPMRFGEAPMATPATKWQRVAPGASPG